VKAAGLIVHRLHQQDLDAVWGAVMLPHALVRKYRSADRQSGWQWVFPQRNRWKDFATAKQGCHHHDPSLVQKAKKQAVADTTMVYAHVLMRGPMGVISPAEQYSSCNSWIPGPITTVRNGYKLPKATAVVKVNSSARKWFSEGSSCSTVVLGNYPHSVRCQHD
jgi:hypothetical protein